MHLRFAGKSVILITLLIQSGAAELVAADAPRHLMLRFDRPAQTERLRSAGIRVFGRNRDGSVVVSVPENQSVADLGATWAGEVPAHEKVAETAAAASNEPTFLIFQFYEDVDMSSARELLWDSGVLVREHTDLEPWQLLGLADLEAAFRIAGDERVAYVFPASEEITSGIPVIPCRSAITEDGAPALLTASIGNGWDGAGQGAAGLTYSFGPITGQLPPNLVRDTVRRALDEWSRHVHVTFTETTRRAGSQNIDILFGKTSHGDQYPFEGRGGVLAHTFYPAPPNSEPLAGDLHLDDDEVWNGGNLDLYSVILHEIGHALGLGHSTDPTSVMYPFYRRLTVLTTDDIQSIQRIYAAVGSTSTPAPLDVIIDPARLSATATTAYLTGRVSGGRDPISVTWSTEMGAFGAARGLRDWNIPLVPLVPGPNRVTVTASDSTATTASKTVVLERGQSSLGPPVIEAAEPVNGSTLPGPTVRVRGTAAHPSGIESVAWRNLKTGGAGIAAGTGVWEIPSVPLASGSNEIRLDAKALDGSTASKSILVTMVAGSTAPGSPPAVDTSPPSITITSPASASTTVTAAQITVKGTARDNTAVAAVSWTSAAGQSGVATGTTSWSVTIPLYTGINNLVIRATDTAGNSSWRSLSVTRR